MLSSSLTLALLALSPALPPQTEGLKLDLKPSPRALDMDALPKNQMG